MQRRVLLIIGGGIAAYKSLELIRELGRRGVSCRCILTSAAKEFVTPLSVAALSGETVYDDLFSLTDETEMGHIQLSRSADLIVVAPATADLMAKAATGLAGDMATTALLATDTPILMAPAMNVRMWNHPATQRNLARLTADGVRWVGPDDGDMACGEFGPGRMAEPDVIADTVIDLLEQGPDAHAAAPRALALASPGPLSGLKALVTAGPTREPIDPVRYLSNHSSGRQGYAIAETLARFGAETTLVSGPTELEPPRFGVKTIGVETALEMLSACQAALPADILVAVAAVADWRPAKASASKRKTKGATDAPAPLALIENPDILATLAADGPARPRLVVGFAAETHDVLRYARAKRVKKNADWMVANDVAGDVMGGTDNAATLITAAQETEWPRAAKSLIAERLVEEIAAHFGRADRRAAE